MKKKNMTQEERLFKYGFILLVMLICFGQKPVLAKTLITGTVTDDQKIFLTGCLVKAYDYDGRTKKGEFMGQANTNSKGLYTIRYRDKRWDSFSLKATKSIYPDIYIEVFIKDASSRWMLVYKSKRYNNWNLSNNLTINIQLDNNKSYIYLEGARKSAEDAAIRAREAEMRLALLEQQLDEAKANYEEAKEHFKKAMEIIEEHHQRQKDAASKIR